MSKYTYAGDFVNPTDSWRVGGPNAEGKYFIECHRKEEIEHEGQVGTFEFWSPHTSGHLFDEVEEAEEYMQGIEESFEEDYDDYLEENRYAIVQMERYEQWRNEY